MTTPNLYLSPGLSCNNIVLQVGRTVSPGHYFTLGVHLPLSSSPPTNPRPIKPLIWESRICRAVVMSRVGVSCIVDAHPRVSLTLWFRAQRLLPESNTRGDVLKNRHHQLPLVPPKSMPVPVVTTGSLLRRRQPRGLGRDGPAFQTSRFACLVQGTMDGYPCCGSITCIYFTACASGWVLRCTALLRGSLVCVTLLLLVTRMVNGEVPVNEIEYLHEDGILTCVEGSLTSSSSYALGSALYVAHVHVVQYCSV
ncbi:hypothetical protein EDB87DRAFT_1622985 [Lactarius vividus]|nr:hypothetical protein EDB87DRAFT_1622985 [Lactarius vividus]